MLNVKKLLIKILERIPVDYGGPVELTSSYSTLETAYVVPKDGIIRVNLNYRASLYKAVKIYNSDDVEVAMIQQSSTSGTGMSGSNITFGRVFKGNKIVVDGTSGSTYSKIFYTPYVTLGETLNL